MKTQIDIKSVLCGVAIGVLAVFTIGAGISSNPVGKYQVAVGGAGVGAIAVMVDTQTGQAWGIDTQRTWKESGNFFDAK